MSDLLDALRSQGPVGRIRALDRAQQRESLSDAELDAIVDLLDDHRHDDLYNGFYDDQSFHDGRVVKDVAHQVLAHRDAAIEVLCRGIERHAAGATWALGEILREQRAALTDQRLRLCQRALRDREPSHARRLLRWELARRDGSCSHLDEVVAVLESGNRIVRLDAWNELEQIGGRHAALAALEVVERCARPGSLSADPASKLAEANADRPRRQLADRAAATLEQLGPVLAERRSRLFAALASYAPWSVPPALVRAVAAYGCETATHALLQLLIAPNTELPGWDGRGQLEAAIQLARMESEVVGLDTRLDEAAQLDSKVARRIEIARDEKA